MPRNPAVQVRLKPEDFEHLRETWGGRGSWPEFVRNRLVGIPATPNGATPDPGIPRASESSGIPTSPDPGIPAEQAITASAVAKPKPKKKVEKINPRPHYCRQDRVVAGGWYCTEGHFSSDNGRTWR